MRAILILATVAILAIVGFVAFDPSLQQQRQQQAYYQAERNRLELDRQALDLQRYQATQPSRVTSDYGFQLLILVGCGAILWVAFDAYHQRRQPVVRFGGYPVARALVTGGDQLLIDMMAEAIRAAGVAQIEAARNVGQPHTYSPHLIIRGDTAPALATAPIAALASVPTFATLLDTQAIGVSADGRRQPLILGYGSAGAITGDWRSLYSSGIGGLQGSGKTWSASFLLAQSALNGGRLVICDPHSGDDESLANRVQPLAPAFVCDIADDDRAILSALRLADDILQRRKAGDPDRQPLIVAIDEWSSLRRGELAELLPHFVEDFSTEGRKLNCHVMLLAQRWDKAAVGDFRNTLASSYVFRMRPDEARMMTGLRANVLPQDTLQLQSGCAYLLDTHGQIVKVQIPQMTPGDLARVGELLKPGFTDRPFGFQPSTRKTPDETQMKPGFETHETRPASGETPTAEAARILALFQAGKTIGEIVKAIYGELSGPKYNQARSEVEQAIRQALASA